MPPATVWLLGSKQNGVRHEFSCLIIAYFDPDSDIEVMTNVIWAHINGTRYAFSYEPSKSVIQIKKGSTKGKVLRSIDNSLTVKELINIFESLSNAKE